MRYEGLDLAQMITMGDTATSYFEDWLNGFVDFYDSLPFDSDFELSASAFVNLVDASGGAVSVTVPSAADYRFKGFYVKRTDATANAITLNAADLIDGNAVLNVSGSILIVSDGTTWHVLSQTMSGKSSFMEIQTATSAAYSIPINSAPAASYFVTYNTTPAYGAIGGVTVNSGSVVLPSGSDYLITATITTSSTGARMSPTLQSAVDSVASGPTAKSGYTRNSNNHNHATNNLSHIVEDGGTFELWMGNDSSIAGTTTVTTEGNIIIQKLN